MSKIFRSACRDLKNAPRRITIVLILLFPLISFNPAAEAGWQEAGVRMGIQAGKKHAYFHQYDVFAVYGLPWDWRWSSGWGLTPQLNTSAGVLDGADETGFIGSVGTGLVLNKPGNGIALDVGINANLLDRRRFGGQDFGSLLQFGAYLGVTYRFANRLGIGYHLQHISNGHIFYPNGTPNPGLDMHLIGVSWSF